MNVEKTSLQDKQIEMADINLIRIFTEFLFISYYNVNLFSNFGVHENNYKN